MTRWVAMLLLAGIVSVQIPAGATENDLIKVLPEYLDLKGRNALTPSLYERDVYQTTLREHPERRSGIRFYVQWRLTNPAWEPLLVRVELRGIAEGKTPRRLVLEQPLTNSGGPLSHWAEITLNGEAYKQFGAVTAWRATLWEGQTLIGRQQSFLW